MKWNILEKKTNLAESLSDLLTFFGVSSISAWEDFYLEQNVAYRKSSVYKSQSKPISTWLRIGEILSESTTCSTFDKKKFKSALDEIKNMTNQPVNKFLKAMNQKCAESGVSLVFVPELPKTHVSGATKWLKKDKTMIILSLRHKKDDHFIKIGNYSHDDIVLFAKQLNIAPGIVVGRLQHDNLVRYSWHNKLKRKFEFKNSPSM